ncbi:MAG TPA: phytanoyl-CoA dioxygenase family protein [Acidimicrobiales bacterium]|nr:phytanoyl-CoA dioxygenase family protein [Acidimicrobiales bacterium]
MHTDHTSAVRAWREDGFTILPALIPAEELAAAVEGLRLLYPTADEFHDGVNPERNARFADEFGGIDDFPFPSVELSLLAVHPRLIGLAQQFLDTNDVRVFSIEAWAKYTGAADYEQHLHRDYLAHTLMAPSSDPRFAQVEMFVYLGDVPVELGPPAFVPLRYATHLPAMPNYFPPGDGIDNPEYPTWVATTGHPDLYAHEVRAAGPAGTVVAYTNRTLHRGTQLNAPRGARYTLHVNFRPAASDWQARHSWVLQSNSPAWHAFVRSASPEQLALFGWPAPGHPFWTEETLTGVCERYPGFDAARWRRAVP